MVHEKNKPMVQVHKRETLLHNKNRITHLKKKYKKLHTITFLYIYAYVHMHVHSYT